MSNPRRKRKPKTPLEKAAAPAVAPEQQPPPLPDPETLPADLLFQREMAYATCAGIKFGDWLNDHGYGGRTCTYQREAVVCQRCPGKMCPLATCIVGETLLPIFVEAMLMGLIAFPDLIPRWEGDDEEEDEHVVTAADAHRAGLTVVRRRPGKHKPRPTMPGCKGIVGGIECGELRRYGAKFCPQCEKAERERESTP